jgi:23S rRNA (guanine745-N1)-methyltransferase
VVAILKCPVCDGLLTLGAASASCELGHSFDRARSGYLNLLRPGQTHSPEPGDSPGMLRSRRAILQAGIYEPLAAGTHAAAAQVLGDRTGAHIADLGCGEGFFFNELKRRLPAGHHYYGVDISRAGVKMTTTYDREITWIVASLHESPFIPQSLDVALSMFAPIAPADVKRILRPDGALITVTPGPDHLDALRAIIYPTVIPHPATPALMAGETGFNLESSTRVRSEASLHSNAKIMNLLAMTPYYWNISLETKARVEACASLAFTVDAYVTVFRSR